MNAVFNGSWVDSNVRLNTNRARIYNCTVCMQNSRCRCVLGCPKVFLV